MKILAFFSLLLILSSCYKESALEGEAISRIQGTWVITAWTSSPAYTHTFSDGSVGSFRDLFKLYLPCRHDDEYFFSSNNDSGPAYWGSYIYREGALACGEETIRESGTWFIDDHNKIYIYFELPGSEPFNRKIRKIYKIEELTENRLVFTYQVQSGHIWREEYRRK